MVEQRRAKNVALTGLGLQTVLLALMLILFLWTHSVAAMASLWLLGGGMALWALTAIMMYCRQLERQEAIELEDLSRGGKEATIFQRDKDTRPAAARVAWVDRWVVAGFTLAWAGFHVATGISMLRYLTARETFPHMNAPLQAVLLLGLAAFAGLLLGAYSIGMSRVPRWRLLRAAGSYLLVNTVFIGLVGAAVFAAWVNYAKVDIVIAFVIPIAQLVLSVELVLNFVLDIYRPRLPGQEHRPSFDSRLFNLVAEPDKVGHSIAEAMNYQFGFEVSKTWFYQLVGRSLVPLLIAGAAIMIAMTSLVIIPEGHSGIIRHLGRLQSEQPLPPGVYAKWPWPIDSVQRFETGKVNQILLGTDGPRDAAQRDADFIMGREIALWTQEHGAMREADFIIAVPAHGDARKIDEAPPVNIIKLVVSVQYKVKDLHRYLNDFVDADKIVHDIACRELTRYCASATLDSPVADSAAADRPEAIMTYGRQRAAAEMMKKIQEATDALGSGNLNGRGLGIEVTHVGLLAVHPPAAVAPDFEKVLKAERAQDEMRFQAEAEATRLLTNVAGDQLTALHLALAIQRLQELDELQPAIGKPDFARKLGEYIRSASDNIQVLNEELELEQLGGKAREESLSGKAVLRAKFLEHLAQLQQIQETAAKGGKFDFAAASAAAAKDADLFFAGTTGEPAAMVARAGAYRWQKEMKERGRWDAFPRELAAYQASPSVYMLDRWLAVWDEVLPNAYKYVLAVDRDLVECRLNLHRESDPLQVIDPTDKPPPPTRAP